jgi:transcriptional regulator with XRE-family HTH domain
MNELSFVEALKKVRASFNESQWAFAKRLGVSLNSVGKWEMGYMKPAPQRIEALAAIAEERGLLGAAIAFQLELADPIQVARDNERLRRALLVIQWPAAIRNGEIVLMCQICDQVKKNGHAPDCIVGAALA